MDLLEQIVARAKADKQRIVLPEAEEERTLKAADRVLADDIADLILIGNPANIHKLAAEWGLKNIDKAAIVDPENNPKREEYAEKLAELRKKKGMTLDQARELVTKNNLYLGCMIIKTEGADGQISGALSTTGDTLRPALQIIKCAPGITCVSGAMLILTHEQQYGENGIVVMGDVAVTPNPTADQLAQIAYTTAETAKSVAGFQNPHIAMLSFSFISLTRWLRRRRLPKRSFRNWMWTASCRPMLPLSLPLPPRKHRALPLPERRMCLSFRTLRSATSVISSLSVSAVRKQSDRFSKVLPARSTTFPAAAAWMTSIIW